MHATNFLFASSYNILILLAFVAFVAKAIQLYAALNKGNAKESDTATYLNMLLLLSGAMILLGVLGYFSELAASPCKEGTLPGGSFVTVICTVVETTGQADAIADCFIKSRSAMTTGLFTAAVSGLVWFGLQQKIAK